LSGQRAGSFLLLAVTAAPVDGRAGIGNANFHALKDKYKEQPVEEMTRARDLPPRG